MSLSGLWYPGKPEEREPYAVCRIPCGPEGEVCGHVIYADENNPERVRISHQQQCVKDNEHWIHRNSPRARLPLFHDPDNFDHEIRDHMQKVGKRMIAEGRLEVRKNERAGFS